MVAAMNDITDTPNWYTLIDRCEVVEQWRRKAFEKYTLMSDRAWDWCLQELHDKAKLVQDQYHVRVLDVGPCICKSDTLDLQKLANEVRKAAKPLLDDFVHNDLHNKRSEVSTFVDPLMFPLVYGESPVLPTGRVRLDSMFGSSGNVEIAPAHVDKRTDSAALEEGLNRLPGPLPPRGLGTMHVRESFYRWSYNYQALPFDVKFTENAISADDKQTRQRGAQIVSYVNNIHPVHKSMYRQIEQCILRCIPMWNDCLIRASELDPSKLQQLGRVPLRILTFGIEWENELPEWLLAFQAPSDYDKKRYWKAKQMIKEMKEAGIKTAQQREDLKRVEGRLLYDGRIAGVAGRETMTLPPKDSELWTRLKEFLELPERNLGSVKKVQDGWDKADSVWNTILRKQRRLLQFKHPEPGLSFSCEDWKSGRNNNKAIIGPAKDRAAHNSESIVLLHERYELDLQESFRETGLQIHLKIQSVDLEPYTSGFQQEDWDMEGQLNDHIIGIAILPYDIENLIDCRIEFRQAEAINSQHYEWDEERRSFGGLRNHYYPSPKATGKLPRLEEDAFEDILGMKEGDLSSVIQDEWGYKRIGSVATPQGRLITFPNVLEHRLEPLKLKDPTKPAHYRVIKLFLVDPNYQICSTRNVPPQQFDWWAREVIFDLVIRGKLVSREIANLIMDFVEDWLMKLPEARRHRVTQLKERRWNDAVRYSCAPSYGFV